MKWFCDEGWYFQDSAPPSHQEGSCATVNVNYSVNKSTIKEWIIINIKVYRFLTQHVSDGQIPRGFPEATKLRREPKPQWKVLGEPRKLQEKERNSHRNIAQHPVSSRIYSMRFWMVLTGSLRFLPNNSSETRWTKAGIPLLSRQESLFLHPHLPPP